LGFICTVLVSCLLSQPLCAGSDAGNLAITKAWSRATPGGAKIAGGYLTIENRGSAPDRLLSGSTGLARSIEVHEMVVSNGLMMMRPIDGGLTTLAGWQAGCAFFARPYRRLPLFASDCSCQPTSA
jgi:hypothetical protein